MNQKKNEVNIDIIRTKSSVRIGVTETTSIAVKQLSSRLEVTKKGRDFLIYDRTTGRLTEVPSGNIAYIQYESDIQQTDNSGEGSSS